jgi:hypothetical protein
MAELEMGGLSGPLNSQGRVRHQRPGTGTRAVGTVELSREGQSR